MGKDFRETLAEQMKDPEFKKVWDSGEVLNMLMTEWNTVEFGKVQRAEGVAETLLELVER